MQNGVFFVHNKAPETKYQQCFDYLYIYGFKKSEKKKFGVKKMVKQVLAPIPKLKIVFGTQLGF